MASEHVSDYPIGTIIPVRYRRPYLARLVRRECHGEEWRIETERGGYVFSVGYRDMLAHRDDTKGLD